MVYMIAVMISKSVNGVCLYFMCCVLYFFWRNGDQFGG